MQEKDDIARFYDEAFRRESKTFKSKKLPFVCQVERTIPSRVIKLLSVKEGGRLLDVACGTGMLLTKARERGLECYGIDISEEAIKQTSGKVEATLEIKDVNEGLPFPTEFFDYITCVESLEHFQNQVFVIREMARTLKAGGKVIITVPNENFIVIKLGHEIDPQPVVKRYTLCEWTNVLESNGLYVKRVLKNNALAENWRSAGTWFNLCLKLLGRPLVPLLPLSLSVGFIFLCEKGMRVPS